LAEVVQKMDCDHREIHAKSTEEVRVLCPKYRQRRNQERLRAIFPVELQWSLAEVVQKMDCDHREIHAKSTGEVRVLCPKYRQSLLEKEGAIEIWILENRVHFVQWLSAEEVSPERVLGFDDWVSQLQLSVDFTNRDNERELWKDAVVRGEWFHRWSMGNGYFAYYVSLDPGSGVRKMGLRLISHQVQKAIDTLR
jgi:hypothetical protein